MRSIDFSLIQFFEFKASKLSANFPLLSCSVSAGFPSPADDHLDNSLDLIELLIKHPAATFFVRATGNSMQGVGIREGDILVVDRSETPINDSMVIAAVDGECLVKIYRTDGKSIWLQSANPMFPSLPINEENDFQIWGVVTGVVRQHGSNGRVCAN